MESVARISMVLREERRGKVRWIAFSNIETLNSDPFLNWVKSITITTRELDSGTSLQSSFTSLASKLTFFLLLRILFLTLWNSILKIFPCRKKERERNGTERKSFAHLLTRDRTDASAFRFKNGTSLVFPPKSPYNGEEKSHQANTS